MIGETLGGGGGKSLNDSRRGVFLSLLLFLFVNCPMSSHIHYTLHLFLCWLNRWGDFRRDNQFVWYSTITREGSQEEQASKADWHRLVWYAIILAGREESLWAIISNQRCNCFLMIPQEVWAIGDREREVQAIRGVQRTCTLRHPVDKRCKQS